MQKNSQSCFIRCTNLGSNDHGNGNWNVKKVIGSIRKTTNSASATHFWKFRRSPPLNVTSLKWSPLITFDDFRNPPPPPCLYFLSKFEWSPLWILPKFSAISPFGFSVTTDAPVCFPKNQVIPPIMTGPLAGKNGHRKHIFSKKALRSGDFWKRRLFVFEYDDVIH